MSKELGAKSKEQRAVNKEQWVLLVIVDWS
jgi:hypothetical protein